MKKLLGSLCLTCLLITGTVGIVGCGDNKTTGTSADPKKAKIEAAEKALAAAEKALKDAAADIKKEDKDKLQKAVDDAKKALEEAKK